MSLPGGLSQAEFDRRKIALNQKMSDIIARQGWMVMGVGSSGVEPAFAYTIGLTQFNLPELLIVGNLSMTTLQGLVNPIAQKMAINKEAIKIGPQPSGFTLKTEEELRLVVRPVTDRDWALQKYMLQAVYRYGTSVQVMQVIWGDDKNVLPGEPGYNTQMTQPLV